jgi:hypothetical protein
MNDTGAIQIVPKTRIKPYDGMSVTAEVWDQAHDEHRKMLEAHARNLHGYGTVCGLKVTANDPPDQYVFISPGMAVDPTGQVIVLPEPVAYDFGSAVDGELYLMLGRGEREVEGVQRDVRYIQNEFVVAARPSLPKRPAVELARITLSQRGASIRAAANPEHPGPNELDLRYRRSIEPQINKLAVVGVVSLGEKMPELITGWDQLNAFVRRSDTYQLVIDELPELVNLSRCSLLYLAGRGRFQLDPIGQNELRIYLDSGKPIIMEAFDSEGADSLMVVLSQMNLTLEKASESSALYRTPHLFGVAPEGPGGSQVSIGKQVVLSQGQYALAWTGSGMNRSDIRSAHEFGANLIHFCLAEHE